MDAISQNPAHEQLIILEQLKADLRMHSHNRRIRGTLKCQIKLVEKRLAQMNRDQMCAVEESHHDHNSFTW